MIINAEELQNLINQKYSVPQIAKMYGMNKSKLYRYCEQCGIEFSPKIRETELRELVKAGNSIEQIAFKLDCTRVAVYRALDRFGIARPEPGYDSVHTGDWTATTPKIKMCDEGAKNLAAAIIELAAQDYKALIQSKGEYICFPGVNQENKESFRRFFRSDFFDLLTTIVIREDIDPEKIISGIESGQVKKKSRRYNATHYK